MIVTVPSNHRFARRVKFWLSLNNIMRASPRMSSTDLGDKVRILRVITRILTTQGTTVGMNLGHESTQFPKK